MATLAFTMNGFMSLYVYVTIMSVVTLTNDVGMLLSVVVGGRMATMLLVGRC